MAEWPSWLVDGLLAKGGPWALVVAMAGTALWLLVTGRVVTRAQHRQTIQLIRDQVKEKESLVRSLWSQISALQKLDAERDRRFDELLEGNRTLIAALERPVPPPGRGRRP